MPCGTQQHRSWVGYRINDGGGELSGEAPQAATRLMTNPSLPRLPAGCVFLTPKRLADNIAVVLLPTAHVSKTSCDDVIATMCLVRPAIVLVELCEARSAMLLRRHNVNVPSLWLMLEQIRRGAPVFGTVYGWFLSAVAESIDVVPGDEFRLAYEAARSFEPEAAKLFLGDRPVGITIKRTWAALTTWDKIKLVFSFVSEATFLPQAEELKDLVEQLKSSDMVTECIKEMGKEFPRIITPLLHERDLYLTQSIREACRHVTVKKKKVECGMDKWNGLNPTIVAIVGAGHVRGIVEAWENDTEINKHELEALPPLSLSKRCLSYMWQNKIKILLQVGVILVIASINRSHRLGKRLQSK